MLRFYTAVFPELLSIIVHIFDFQMREETVQLELTRGPWRTAESTASCK